MPAFGAVPAIFWLIITRPTRIGSRQLGKVADTHSIGSISYLNLGMFAVAEITAKYADPFPPAHLIAGTQNTPYKGLQGCRAPTVPLTGLARFSRGQSSCTGHIAPH